MPKAIRLVVVVVVAIALLSRGAIAVAGAGAAPAEHVVVIGLDGARPEALQQAAGPVLRDLLAQGSVSWRAQATRPTVTQVNWASMLTGCLPSQHGIDRHPITEAELAPQRVRVPSVFSLVAREGRRACGFFGHWKLYPLESQEPGVSFVRSPYEALRVAPLAAAHLRAERPAFGFVWMGDLDGLGHRYGWLSAEQLAGMTDIDVAIGELVAALREAGMWETTVLILTADHGGHDRGHGQGTAEDATVPWLIVGPGIRRGHTIEAPVSVCDTAATALFALGLPIPPHFDGKPVREAFADAPVSE